MSFALLANAIATVSKSAADATTHLNETADAIERVSDAEPSDVLAMLLGFSADEKGVSVNAQGGGAFSYEFARGMIEEYIRRSEVLRRTDIDPFTRTDYIDAQKAAVTYFKQLFPQLKRSLESLAGELVEVRRRQAAGMRGATSSTGSVGGSTKSECGGSRAVSFGSLVWQGSLR